MPSAAAAASGVTRGATTVLPGQTPEGAYILSVLVKRSFDINPGKECTLAAADKPLIPGDVFWDDPMNSSVRYESDFIPFKQATDVVVEGVAHAPGGMATSACTVSVRVDRWSKSVAVIGDRVARYANGQTPVFTDPARFTRMDLRYERAYGGTDVYSDPQSLYPYPRNPLGRGFVLRNTAQTVDNLPLPNLEDPTLPLTPASLCVGDYAAWESRPMPAGFGWIAKTWLPRALLAGIMPADRPVEQELRQAYAELLPADQRQPYLENGIRDMDFQFFNGASPGLVVPYLQGGEWVATENLSRGGAHRFQLPTPVPRIGLDIGDGVQEPQVVLQTVMIRMEDEQVDLVWRGAVSYRGPDWLPEMRRMDVLIA
jgi:hypothetical protein